MTLADFLCLLVETQERFVYYMRQTMHGFWLKAAFATMATVFTEIMFGDIAVLTIYCICVLLDMVLGVLSAVVHDNFSSKYLLYWLLKVFASVVMVSVIGLAAYSLFRTAGITIAAVNWVLFCCTLTEVASIMKNLRKLGCPVHPVFVRVIEALRKIAKEREPAMEDKA